MAGITVLFGVILSGLGVGGWVWSGASLEHMTALIPAAFGLALIVLGIFARKEKVRMHVMHAAVFIGLIGVIVPAVMAFPKLPALIQDGVVTRANGTDATKAVLLQTAMAAICIVYVGLCVNSFIAARIARRRAAAQ